MNYDETKYAGMLEAAVHRFNEDRSKSNFLNVIVLLRDSFVWVPCTAVMSEADQSRMEEMIKSLNGDLEKLVGMDFTAHDETRFIPDILQSGEEYFFPIFSSDEAMGEYGENFSKIEKHFLDVIPLARYNEKKPVGIVLNAFTEPFVIDKEIWNLISK